MEETIWDQNSTIPTQIWIPFRFFVFFQIFFLFKIWIPISRKLTLPSCSSCPPPPLRSAPLVLLLCWPEDQVAPSRFCRWGFSPFGTVKDQIFLRVPETFSIRPSMASVLWSLNTDGCVVEKIVLYHIITSIFVHLSGSEIRMPDASTRRAPPLTISSCRCKCAQAPTVVRSYPQVFLL